jgi:hypothetical protein
MLRSTGVPSPREVIKLGGSLLMLPDWPMHVAELVRERAAERPVLLVVGGGAIQGFALRIRRLHVLPPGTTPRQ